uniref:Reverse transcriptase domain-containing protein n=1 Tax=Fagus sylvatica TaxID=28930 RepID=A0A2N9IWX8_FAGSY
MKRKKGYVGFKLDFKKAYDSLEWEFILSVLRAMGFDQKLIMLIHQCISTVHYTLLLNGTKSSSIKPSRGLRQGDPLSPYLFIMCADVLARMINKEVLRGAINGINPKILPLLKKNWNLEQLVGKAKLFLGWVEPLIKSVARASPVYAMTSCKLPRKLCSEMDSVVQRFWWSPKNTNSKCYTPIAWKDLCLPLDMGGLGFRSFESFNEAIIAKLAWWRFNQRDRWIWIKSSSGEFLVKSAYKEVCSLDLDSEGTAVMKRLWKTQLHQRLKMLLWRIAAGVLPTHDSLVRFVPNLDMLCPLCNACSESVIHLFWECSLARAMWFGIAGIYTDHFQLDSKVDLVEAIVFPSNDLANSFTLKGALIIDLLWKARNHIVHEDGVVEAKSLMLDFDKKWRDHSTVFFKSVSLVKSCFKSFSWERQKVGVIKINCDAVMNTIIPLQAEAKAILWAGQLAVHHGFLAVIIESDCKEYVQVGNRVRRCPW